MPIPVTCTNCRSRFVARPEHAGRRGRCPKCKTILAIPNVVSEDAIQVGRSTAGRELAGGPAARSPDAKPLEREELLRRIVAAFEGRRVRVRPGILYRVGLLAVTAGMILLPVLYVALIAAVGWLICYHAVHNVDWITTIAGVRIGVFLYGAPLVSGGIVIAFMIKPLFAPPARAWQPCSLFRDQEPLLFAFVECVRRALGAPEPKRIDVDCQVNASASFRRGFRSLFGRDLVLTLGLPLVGALSVGELASLLTHELAHFSQGVGMRLTYVIRRVNGWFARVVYDRDQWDETLAAWSEEESWMSLIALLARFFVWLTRRVLWLLMVVGELISATMLRQLEWHADRCAIHLAGSRAFERGREKLVLLSVATDFAGQILNSAHRRGQLPDDYMVLTASIAGAIPDDVRRQIVAAHLSAKTGFFDSHPAAKDRVRHARALAAEGIFRSDLPATFLMSNFAMLSKAATRDMYRFNLRWLLKHVQLVPTSDLLTTLLRQTAHPSS